MGSLNINSLSKHIYELRFLVADNHFDVLSINEAKLDHTISYGQISPSGYSCVRKDGDKLGSDVCLYIRDSLKYSRISSLECDDLEMNEVRNPNLMYSRDRLKNKAVKSNVSKAWVDYRRLKNKINNEIMGTKKTFHRHGICNKQVD